MLDNPDVGQTRRPRDIVPVAVSDVFPGKGRRTSVLKRLLPAGGEGDHYNEELLQRIVHRSPEILPLWDIEPAFHRAESVCCELPVGPDLEKPLGYLDNLLLTPDGGIVLVECKLIRSAESKRAVVAQLLSYVAELSRMSYSQLEAAVRKARRDMKTRWQEDFDPDASLYSISADRASGLDEDRFVEVVTRNLRRGQMLGLIVGDGISGLVRNVADLLAQLSTKQFSLGLVQLDIFRMPGEAAFPYLVIPHIEARTEILRLTVRIVDGVVVDPAPAPAPEPAAAISVKSKSTTTLTRELFFEALGRSVAAEVRDRIREFVSDCEALGCEIRGATASISIRAVARDGHSWSLGSLTINGDLGLWGLNRLDAAYGTTAGIRYMENVAALVPGTRVNRPADPKKDAEVRMPKGNVRLADLVAKRDGWFGQIQSIVDQLRALPTGEDAPWELIEGDEGFEYSEAARAPAPASKDEVGSDPDARKRQSHSEVAI